VRSSCVVREPHGWHGVARRACASPVVLRCSPCRCVSYRRASACVVVRRRECARRRVATPCARRSSCRRSSVRRRSCRSCAPRYAVRACAVRACAVCRFAVCVCAVCVARRASCVSLTGGTRSPCVRRCVGASCVCPFARRVRSFAVSVRRRVGAYRSPCARRVGALAVSPRAPCVAVRVALRGSCVATPCARRSSCRRSSVRRSCASPCAVSPCAVSPCAVPCLSPCRVVPKAHGWHGVAVPNPTHDKASPLCARCARWRGSPCRARRSSGVARQAPRRSAKSSLSTWPAPRSDKG